jgi:hypothetical protein
MKVTDSGGGCHIRKLTYPIQKTRGMETKYSPYLRVSV